jgi:acetyltransferase-like isoleucine patch superfamily enzyme
MRRVKSQPRTGEKNALARWHQEKSPYRVAFNFAVISIAKVLPSLALKRFALRSTGMKIEGDVAIGLGVQFDIFYPELITLKKNCLIGYNATILCHEFLVKEFRQGEVVVGENALLGANSTVLPGVRLGKNAVVSAMSLVNRDVKENEFVGGVPIKTLKAGR